MPSVIFRDGVISRPVLAALGLAAKPRPAARVGPRPRDWSVLATARPAAARLSQTAGTCIAVPKRRRRAPRVARPARIIGLRSRARGRPIHY